VVSADRILAEGEESRRLIESIPCSVLLVR
jgi:hypothetical protein